MIEIMFLGKLFKKEGQENGLEDAQSPDRAGKVLKFERKIRKEAAISEDELEMTQFNAPYQMAKECRNIILKNGTLNDEETGKLREFGEVLKVRLAELPTHQADRPLRIDLEKSIALIHKKID